MTRRKAVLPERPPLPTRSERGRLRRPRVLHRTELEMVSRSPGADYRVVCRPRFRTRWP